MYASVTNESKGRLLASRVRIASSFWDRSKGLLGTASLGSDEGLWLNPCNSIHTLFMRYPIDVLFLNKDSVAVSKETLVPWRLSRWERRGLSALEFSAGTLARTQTAVGDRISIKQT